MSPLNPLERWEEDKDNDDNICDQIFGDKDDDGLECPKRSQ